ncbi:MAG: ACP S-malonyltransferase [Bacillota bacterium]|nr:ACP S-malonyltransferase [Bacillota bacterium]
MGKIAFVFSGQGAQKAGMGRTFYEAAETVRRLFDDAEKIRKGTLRQCFTGTAEELKETQNTQPCLYLADLAAAIALSEAGVMPAGVAGFSLGELPALAFAEAYDPLDGFRLACVRGEVMAKAAAEHPASMVAVMKLENERIEGICKQFRQVYPVNYNAPGQLVTAAAKEEADDFYKAIREAGGRGMPVAVGGGFHSPFMEEAAKAFASEIRKFPLRQPRIPVYSNYTAEPYDENVAALMINQIDHSLRWQESIERMAEDGFDTFIEVGVGDTLKKLIRRILPDARVYSVSNTEEMEKVKEELGC